MCACVCGLCCAFECVRLLLHVVLFVYRMGIDLVTVRSCCGGTSAVVQAYIVLPQAETVSTSTTFIHIETMLHSETFYFFDQRDGLECQVPQPPPGSHA